MGPSHRDSGAARRLELGFAVTVLSPWANTVWGSIAQAAWPRVYPWHEGDTVTGAFWGSKHFGSFTDIQMTKSRNLLLSLMYTLNLLNNILKVNLIKNVALKY